MRKLPEIYFKMVLLITMINIGINNVLMCINKDCKIILP